MISDIMGGNMKIPGPLPSKGYYYHYKHDPHGSVESYAYEVIGIARHSEDGSYLVAYKPLYKNTYLDGADFSVRPLSMFMEKVVKYGKSVPRFQKIRENKVTRRLKAIQKNK
jgi:hypothetical protein